MKKVLILGVAILGVILNSQPKASFAEEQPSTSPNCIVDKNDPYDTGQLMLEGPFKGQCMSIVLQRPALILSEDDSSISIANFYHGGHFWLAKIPKQGVDQIIFQVASFKEPYPLIKFFHTQLRFQMKAGMSAKLTAQDKGSNLADTEISDFALVDQISAPAPDSVYNPVKGLKSAYGNVMRIVDSNDRAAEEMVGKDNEGTVVRQFLLQMSDEDKDAVLLNGIRLSNQLGYDDIYKLFSENCTTVIFKVLDESDTYGKHVRPFKIHFWNVLDPIGGPSIRALDKRGVIEKELPTWNEELHIFNN